MAEPRPDRYAWNNDAGDTIVTTATGHDPIEGPTVEVTVKALDQILARAGYEPCDWPGRHPRLPAPPPRPPALPNPAVGLELDTPIYDTLNPTRPRAWRTWQFWAGAGLGVWIQAIATVIALVVIA